LDRVVRCGILGLSTVTFCLLAVAAHRRGVDELGCQRNLRAGNYHCYRGPLAGRTFHNKVEALVVLGYDPATYIPPHHVRRSQAQRRNFEIITGYPNGRPGYVVDHIIPLACGGADVPGNMQWQTVAAAKAKDKWERRKCKK